MATRSSDRNGSVNGNHALVTLVRELGRDEAGIYWTVTPQFVGTFEGHPIKYKGIDAVEAAHIRDDIAQKGKSYRWVTRSWLTLLPEPDALEADRDALDQPARADQQAAMDGMASRRTPRRRSATLEPIPLSEEERVALNALRFLRERGIIQEACLRTEDDEPE